MSKAYQKAGVDIVKADRFVESIGLFVKATHTSNGKNNVRSVPSGYASLYQISKDQFIAASTDGVGTKLKIAFALKTHDSVGIDLVAMSVNDLLCVGAKPLFFLDYFATGKLDLKTAQKVVKGIAQGCHISKIALTGGETAEMPDMYAKGEYDLAGFAVGIVNKKNLITGKSIKPGDVLVGFKSSGPHSNGFSLIRKIFGADKSLMKKCFAPTKIYVDEVEKLQKNCKVKGLAHITGSGFLNIPRMNANVDYQIEWPKKYAIPRIFLELKKRGKVSWQDMFTTFNMGIGLVAVVDAKSSQKIKGGIILGKVIKQKTKGSPCVFVSGNNWNIQLKY